MSPSEISLPVPVENIHSHPNYRPLGVKKKSNCGFHMFECVRFNSHQPGFNNRWDKGTKRRRGVSQEDLVEMTLVMAVGARVV